MVPIKPKKHIPMPKAEKAELKSRKKRRESRLPVVEVM